MAREKHEKYLILPVCNEESNMKHACYTSSSNNWDSEREQYTATKKKQQQPRLWQINFETSASC